MADVKDRLREVIIKTLRLETVKPEDIQDDTPLFGEGLGLDSIDALELVVALEKEFGIKITDDEVGPQVFQNIGTLAAFIIVAAGILVLRRTRPDLERPFRTPLVPWVPVLCILFCLGLILALPTITHLRFIIWLLIGLVIYFLYGVHHAREAGSALEACDLAEGRGGSGPGE